MKQCDFLCRAAREGDDLKAIARLLHLTDPYIYPTVCTDPEDAEWQRIISACAADDGNIFALRNYQLLLCGAAVAGVACVIPCGVRLHFLGSDAVSRDLRRGFDAANEGYFLPLIEESAEMEGYNITNLCIDPAYRGKGCGELLLRGCIERFSAHPIHLDVIVANTAAVRLYEKCGFERVSEYGGFSGTETPLPCYHMVRKPSL